MLALVRAFMRVLSTIAPGRAAQLAEWFWFRVPPAKRSEEGEAFLATGERFTVAVNGRDVAAWHWGRRDQPAVLLMHGWGGNAGQFRSIIEEIVKRGGSAVTFDALSHGHSAAGTRGPRAATLFEFGDALSAVAQEVRGPTAVVAHSGGCAAVAWAMHANPSWTVPRLVFIAPFGRISRYLAQFQQLLALSDEVVRRFRANTEKEFNFQWEELEVPDLARQMKTPPILVVHDREDKETAYQDGADIASSWPNSRLLSTEGLGHNRILRDPAVVSEIVGFVLGAS